MENQISWIEQLQGYTHLRPTDHVRKLYLIIDSSFSPGHGKSSPIVYYSIPSSASFFPRASHDDYYAHNETTLTVEVHADGLSFLSRNKTLDPNIKTP